MISRLWRVHLIYLRSQSNISKQHPNLYNLYTSSEVYPLVPFLISRLEKKRGFPGIQTTPPRVRAVPLLQVGGRRRGSRSSQYSDGGTTVRSVASTAGGRAASGSTSTGRRARGRRRRGNDGRGSFGGMGMSKETDPLAEVNIF